MSNSEVSLVSRNGSITSPRLLRVSAGTYKSVCASVVWPSFKMFLQLKVLLINSLCSAALASFSSLFWFYSLATVPFISLICFIVSENIIKIHPGDNLAKHNAALVATETDISPRSWLRPKSELKA